MIHRISIHALLAESDTTKVAGLLALIYISIHALLAESDGSSAVFSGCCTGISIHALLAESDADRIGYAVRLLYFYPRSPCGERPQEVSVRRGVALFLSTLSLRRATSSQRLSALQLFQFLSTLSLRRATRHWQTGQSRTRHFYPRSPCGERPVVDVRRATGTADFYPRSPCGERPPKGSDNTGKSQVFLSTLSLRRATIEEVSKYVVKDYFYPRSPCGERRWSMSAAPPARPISIHALLAESDPQPGLYRATHGYFYPRSPCGERPRCIVRPVPGPQISIHALLAESDLPTLAVMLRRS